MRLFTELKRVTELLENYPNQWAICGGVAASIYRASARYTDDIDFALIDSDSITAKELATKIIKELGYQEYQGFVPDPENESKQLNALVCARGMNDDRFKGIDFLLPVQYWVEKAVNLAQSNLIDYGFAVLPTITPESLIFSKFIALNSNAERYKDLDDIQEIIKSNQINLEFLQLEITNCPIKFKPEIIKLLENIK